MKKSTVVAVCVGMMSLASCASSECDYYIRQAKALAESGELQLWADESVFSKRFDRSDVYRPGNFHGPGRFSVSTSVLGTPPPVEAQWGRAVNVRLLGDDLQKPSAVFIGSRNYSGIIVARVSVADWQSAVSKWSVGVSGRIGVICRRD